MLRGSCSCGAVTYAVEDAFEYSAYCHCGGCRRATGSAFKAFGGVRREKLTVTTGADTLLIVGNPEAAHDVRCARCGSLLYSVVREGLWVHVALGSLLDAPTLSPTHHIWVSSKAPWHEITDGLPQHAEF
jgi:hypothetical protein